jgi:hypothetical protein
LATTNLTGTITNAQLAGSIANDKLSNNSLTYTAGSALTGGGEVALGASATLNVAVDDSSIEVSSDALRVKASGITNAMLAGSIANDKLAGSIANDKLAGSIANNKLANDSVSYGGIEVDLGSSDATPAFNLTDATNYPYTSLTGIATHIVGDTTPQLGGDLDGNSKNIYGVGIITATKIADGSGSVGSASSVLSSTGSGLSWVAQSGGSSSTDMLEVMLFT